MSNLKAGFGRVDITPSMGIEIAGYYQKREAEGVLDPLHANAIAVGNGKTTVLFISFDHCGIYKDLSDYYKKIISERTGIATENINIAATHTHTAPHLDYGRGGEKVDVYREFVGQKMADAADFAISDMKPAKMGWKVGNAPNVAFVRRFRMKDGKVRTNPGVGNPDILAPLGDVDERVNVIRFDREGADTILLVNFANHPDVVGGSKISADWPGLLTGIIERCLPGVKSLFINGTQGDVNHVDVNAKDGDMNDLANDFDDVARGYGHAIHIANVVAGAVMQVYAKVNYTDADDIKVIEKTISVPSNKAKPEELPLAHKYNDLHLAGRDDEIPFEAMELTTAVAEAMRMVRLENGPDAFDMKITGISIGNVAFITIPGEGFTSIGRGLKMAEGWDLVCPCGLTNGCEGYFPARDAYDEGGYEAKSSPFKAGVAELFIEEGTKVLNELRK
ncbi:MAG: hypothetical protein IJE62_08795 [Clostridia bacterium]|nr:hypothetical protein [Clostridia bacterium]